MRYCQHYCELRHVAVCIRSISFLFILSTADKSPLFDLDKMTHECDDVELGTTNDEDHATEPIEAGKLYVLLKPCARVRRTLNNYPNFHC